MGDLASLSDIAVALGLSGEDELSESQIARAGPLLSRVSFLFEREAQRDFVPGTSTNRLRVLDRSVMLSENPTEVLSVYDDDGGEIAESEYTAAGRELRFSSRWEFDFVTVAYVHTAPVPPAVSAAVAAIVAQWLRLDTTANPAVGITTDLSADGYRQSFADWTTRSVHLTPEDVAEARQYRYTSPSMVIGS